MICLIFYQHNRENVIWERQKKQMRAVWEFSEGSKKTERTDINVIMITYFIKWIKVTTSADDSPLIQSIYLILNLMSKIRLQYETQAEEQP